MEKSGHTRTPTKECSQCLLGRKDADAHFFFSGRHANLNVQPVWEFNLNHYYGLPQGNSGNKKAASILHSGRGRSCRSYCLDDVVPSMLVEPVSPSASEKGSGMLKVDQPTETPQEKGRRRSNDSASPRSGRDSESPRWNADEQWQSPRPYMVSLSDSPKFVGSRTGTPPSADTTSPMTRRFTIYETPSSDSEDWMKADWNSSRIKKEFDEDNNEVETVRLDNMTTLDQICPDVPELSSGFIPMTE